MKLRTLLLAFAFCSPLVAGADVPPPPGYVESCTVALQCKADEDGDTCRAWHGDRDACKTKHKDDGYTYRCSTRGASVWSEVWCAPKKPTTTPTPKLPVPG